MKKITTIFFLILAMCTFSTVSFAVEKEVKKEKSKKGWLGVAVEDVTPKFAREKSLKVKEGAFINEVVEESPADSIGLLENDVIVEFNGKTIETADDLVSEVRNIQPGSKASITVWRGDAQKKFSVNIRKNKMRNRMPIPPMMPNFLMHSLTGIEGLKLLELNKQLGEYFEAPNGRGLLVQDVKKKSNGEKAGLKAGDVITKINKENVEDLGDIHDALDDIEEGTKVDIEYLRKGVKKTTNIEISEQEDQNMFFKFNDEDGDGHKMFQFKNMHPNAAPQMEKEIEIQMNEQPKTDKKIREIKIRTKKSDEV